MVIMGLLTLSQPRIALLNNVMAVCGGGLAIGVLQKAMGSYQLIYWKMVMCFQGAVAGLVTVTSGGDLYHPALALALGTLGAMISHIVTRLFSMSCLEDYLNVIPVHLVCGILGSLFSPVYSPDYSASNVGRELYWQLVGILAILGLTVIVLVPLFLTLMSCNLLRDQFETNNHNRAMRMAKEQSVIWFGRILRQHRTLPHLRPGYASKDVKTFLQTINEESSSDSEGSESEGAGEPSRKVQKPEEVSPPQNVDDHNKSKEQPNKLHLMVFGREPPSKDVARRKNSHHIVDSITELVECGTKNNHCASEKLYQMYFMNISEKPAVSADSSSVHIPDTQTIVLIDEKPATSTQTSQHSIHLHKSPSPSIEQPPEHISDQTLRDKFENTLHMLQLNPEGDNQSRFETPVKCVSELPSYVNRDRCLIASDHHDTNPGNHLSQDDSSVKTRRSKRLQSPRIRARIRHKSSLSGTDNSKTKKESDSNLAAQNKLQTKSVSMKGQLEESAGDT